MSAVQLCYNTAMAVAIPKHTFAHREETARRGIRYRGVMQHVNLVRSRRIRNFMTTMSLRGAGKTEGLRIATCSSRSVTCNPPTMRGSAPSFRNRKRSPAVICHQDQNVKVRLRLDHQVSFGDKHALLGSAEHVGGWQRIVSMDWTKDGWLADLEVMPGESFEYKYLIVSRSGHLTWESGRNRTMIVPSIPTGQFEVVSHWDATQEEIRFVTQNGGISTEVGETEKVDNFREPESGSAEPESEVNVRSSFVHLWQGEKVTIMKSNEHSLQRNGTWDTTGLGTPAKHIVEGDQKSANWWRKLEVVRLLLSGALGKAERLESLINASIYLKLAKDMFQNVYRAANYASMMIRSLKARVLQWINTGQIQCHEDGGHHRPNKHAEISREIFKELECLVADKIVSPEESLVVRKIQPLLPAFKAEFTASVPLTRIRDIAHRNDIPHDLKTEIKHTIQNKLHRNAGPEDLVATELMLARVSSIPGEYSKAFVDQFKIFYDELKDFFNASSLADQLESVRVLATEQEAPMLTYFLESKKSLESQDNNTDEFAEKGLETLLCTLQALVALRAAILKRLGLNFTNGASDDAVATQQKWRLCEIGLEDYSFVLLSRCINSLEKSGGVDWLIQGAKSGSVLAWTQFLKALVFGLRQIQLSGWQGNECIAIQNEITTWQSDSTSTKDDKGSKGNKHPGGTSEDLILSGRRLKASLDRCRRLAETYTDSLLQLYPQRAEKLGKAFGIPQTSGKTYTEAEIRASVMFQLSKLVSLLLKATRTLCVIEGWDAIMPGRAVGTLLEVDRIVPGLIPSTSDDSVILLVRTADGDEEVKAAGKSVAGVILCHEIPHLSHLGIRARQENVVFVTLDDDERISSLKSLLGQRVQLDVSAEGASVSESSRDPDIDLQDFKVAKQSDKTSGSSVSSTPETSRTLSSKVLKSDPGVVLDLADARVETAGSKAAACGKLAVLVEPSAKVQSEYGVMADFKAPHGLVIPFGAMEDALKVAGYSDAYESLVEQTERTRVEGGELDTVCKNLRELVSTLRPMASVVDSIAVRFNPTARLIVRSSANAEDLAGMPGAGLYESIPNVQCSNPEGFGRAVAEVWASLYSRRATLSRRAAGIPQREAAMAVLVQELLSPHLSFVLHTVSPIDGDKNVVQAEIAAGLGETLASGTRGSPWRLAVDKLSGAVKTLAFANFSEELVLQTDGLAGGKVIAQTVDYSTKSLSVDPTSRVSLGQRLGAIGCFLEQQFECAQDIEGCVVGTDVYVVQARPQP